MKPTGMSGVKMVLTLTGEVETKRLAGPEYWCSQIPSPVKYQQSVLKLSSDEEQLVYLEVGPGKTASSMFRHALKNPADFDLFTSIPCGDDWEAEEHIRWVNASLRGWANPLDRVQWNFKRVRTG